MCNTTPVRPWLTIVEGDYSRCIAGYFLTFDPPNTLLKCPLGVIYGKSRVFKEKTLVLTNTICVRANTPYAGNASLFVPFVKGNQNVGSVPGGSLSATVVGAWFTGDLLPLNFYNADTGHWDTPNGVGEMYIFNADGTFTYTGFARVQYQQCTGNVSVYRTGKATQKDAQLTLTPDTAKTRTVTACGSGSDSATDGPYTPKQVTWDVSSGRV